jgi:uncharacterized membrane protein YdjX (TVP38/TMEM64 family)
MLKASRRVYFQLIGFVAAAALLVLISRFVPIVDLVKAAQEHVLHWGVWSAICYPLLFAVCNLLLLPGGILNVGSGFFFGLWWGFAIVVVGNTLSAAIAFIASRWFAQCWLGRKLSQSRTLRALEPAVEQEGWKVIVLSQLHPLFPTSLINYVYGLTRIPFRTYMLWALIGRVPGLFLYTYLGTLGQYGLNVVEGKSHPRAVEYWIWGGAFVTTALLFFVLRRIAVRTMRSSEKMITPETRWGGRKESAVSVPATP